MFYYRLETCIRLLQIYIFKTQHVFGSYLIIFPQTHHTGLNNPNIILFDIKYPWNIYLMISHFNLTKFQLSLRTIWWWSSRWRWTGIVLFFVFFYTVKNFIWVKMVYLQTPKMYLHVNLAQLCDEVTTFKTSTFAKK